MVTSDTQHPKLHLRTMHSYLASLLDAGTRLPALARTWGPCSSLRCSMVSLLVRADAVSQVGLSWRLCTCCCPVPPMLLDAERECEEMDMWSTTGAPRI